MGFNYKNLNGWIIPNINYFRALQEYAIQLEEKIEQLQEQIAVSGSRALQERAEKWASEWQAKCIEVGELRKEIIELESQKNAEICRLQHENDYLQQQINMYQQAEQPKKQTQQRGRDSKTGRFNSSIPASDKPFRAWLMDQQGYSPAQIAYKLGVSTETVKRYVRDQKAKRATTTIQNPDYGQ